ncbi:restriction endonuclease subunit S [Bacteroides acidifaciens]|uniref:restriction endonuclease subunit S n=1 Tax=Bacteroides acidifaciens TaxID=85831 RepID=UPI0025B51332|nr:restriction endonuclease subunit S [Bacteroides acidifaciens]
MANNSNKNKCNVPHLRFPEFTGEWKKVRLGDNCNIQMCKRIMAAQTNTEGGVPFYKIGTIGGKADAYISKDLFNEYKVKYSFPHKGEVMITCAGTVGKCIIYNGEDSYYQDSNIVWIDNPNKIIANDFLYHLLSKINWSHLNSTTIVRIYNDDLRNLKLYYPLHNEQKKITHFLSLINERIATQNKIIEKYESLIKGIAQHCIKESTSVNTYVKLGDICQITTGKLDANAQIDNGIYPFFTCAEQPFKIDSFAFDTEALLISGNGANLGYINYYNGKFNAYQRTYVLDIFSENIQYVKWALKVLLPKRIAIEKSSSNTPYIVLSTLSDLRLPIPNKSNQCHIAKLMQSLERKLSSQIALNGSYNKLKLYLLRQMFI